MTGRIPGCVAAVPAHAADLAAVRHQLLAQERPLPRTWTY